MKVSLRERRRATAKEHAGNLDGFRQLVATQERALFVTGGLGDILALSCFLDTPTKLKAVYYATRRRADVECFLATVCPKETQHVSVWDDYSSCWGWYSLTQFVRSGDWPSGLRKADDWSIMTQFPKLEVCSDRTFLGLPWEVGHPLSTIYELSLPSRYAVLAPFSHDKRDARRDLSATEVTAALRFARERKMPLVLLNQGDDPLIEADGLFNLQNQTNVYGSIDVTIGASLFIGVDSAMSVVASKFLPADKLCIKSVNPHCRRWQHLYFAPHRSFEFVTENPIQRMKELRWTA